MSQYNSPDSNFLWNNQHSHWKRIFIDVSRFKDNSLGADVTIALDEKMLYKNPQRNKESRVSLWMNPSLASLSDQGEADRTTG